MAEKKQIAIVGGGIAGLTTAYYLQKQIRAYRLDYEVKLFEASSHLGGKIDTLKKDGFVIERGPDSFLARKESASRLIHDIGMEKDLVRNNTGQSYILAGKKLHKMPKRAFMGVPTELKPFYQSRLLSTKAKARISVEPMLPKGKEAQDQSMGLFFRRRFGDELVENVLEPLLSGVYAGEIDELSLIATYPKFYEVEQQYGSVIKGLQATMPKPPKQKKDVKPPGAFLSLRNGLGSLVEGLEAKLDPGTVHLETSVDHIERKEDHYHLLLGNGEVFRADAAVLASPFFAVQRMLSQYDFMEQLKEMKATSVATVAMTFDASAIKKDIDGTGFVISRNSKYRITACTWTHKKWEGTTPEGKVMLRCYVGRPDDSGIVDLSDEEIVRIALKDLNKIMKIKSKPLFSVVSRWKKAMPQYVVGHLQRVADVRANMSINLPGVFLAGGSYDGIGIPDCIDSGEQAVQNVLAYLREKSFS